MVVAYGVLLAAPLVADRVFGASQTIVTALGMATVLIGLMLYPFWLWHSHEVGAFQREALVAAFLGDVMAGLAAGEAPDLVERRLGLEPGEASLIMRHGGDRVGNRMLAHAACHGLALHGAAL